MTLVDQNVPWASYPFGPADLFSLVDAHADWCLEAYEFLDPEAAPKDSAWECFSTFSAVLSRPLVTGDPSDNDIQAEWGSLLAVWAYRASRGDVGYHSPRQSSTTLPSGHWGSPPPGGAG